MTRRLSVEAFAKVNRSLVVLGRRPDGYHELDTIFQTVDLTDHMDFLEGEEGEREVSLTIEGGGLVVASDNLILRAARALRERFGVARGARIHLSKKIPVGAGLGGGSSNAAATLRGLSRLWNLSVAADELQSLAAGLGSDVPFFLHGGTARGTGRGEKILPLPDAPAEALVLLFPPFSLSTAAVYGALSAPALTDSDPPSKLRGPDSGEVAPDRNDLESAAESLRGELRGLREMLGREGARRARLSGSGSTVFGVFESMDRARQAAARLAGSSGETGVRVVATVPRGEFLRRSAPAWVE
jgi:4-diphosphocytidyl-2-C-methyl-D-erythritol kinase